MQSANNLLETFLSIYGWYILLAFGFIIFLYYVAPYGWAVYLMQGKLKEVRSFLIQKLGPKSAPIIDVWIEGLDVVKDGHLSEEEMVQEFIKIIKLRAASTDLIKEDDEVVEEAARMTIQSLAGNSKNQAAFKILSKK
jgi:hypothetical protein